MSIKVRYFASLKELLGRGENALEFDQDLSVADVWAKATGLHAMPENTLAALNMEYVALDCVVADGDEVAFFPPVTGG
ncbi:MAG: MoaD/ThiS family protein [Methylococcaceae bacterium]|nr:MoaD/ThiS family protein [Methylococcaceae bacterium]